MNYIPSEIEPKWQKEWEKSKTFKSEINPTNKKFYVLEMFPYPQEKFIWAMLEICYRRCCSKIQEVPRFQCLASYGLGCIRNAS